MKWSIPAKINIRPQKAHTTTSQGQKLLIHAVMRMRSVQFNGANRNTKLMMKITPSTFRAVLDSRTSRMGRIHEAGELMGCKLITMQFHRQINN
jgi:hypothetical protein